ncbi:MAG TPA: FAD-dependent oxidoreductase, partial [Reyranellaceae bacterium]|nr:FAD-dependent oxidoreductase [Reyranellaceae bacterium]
MRKDIYHPDFKAQPWWWEAWTPDNALSQDPPARTDVVIVGAGYGGLSTALELRRNGVACVVLERGDFGVGASTRNGGGVSGGTTMGKGFSGKGVGGDAEAWKQIMQRMLADAADSLQQV